MLCYGILELYNVSKIADDCEQTRKVAEMKKRFIAGAVCPRCGVMDRIVVSVAGGKLSRKECIDCGFNEDAVGKNVPLELETRVSRQTKPNVKAQPIKFFPRMPGTK